MRSGISLVTSLVFLVATVPAWAGMNEGVQMALDIQARNAKRQCAPAYDGCGDITTTYPSTGYYDVMIVVYEYDNFAGTEWTVEWPEHFYFTDFVSCGDLEIEEGKVNLLNIAQVWEAPLVAETDTSGVAVGWIRLWSDSAGTITLQPTSRRSKNLKGVGDSLYQYDTCSGTFSAVVGQASGGDDPCD